MKRNLKKVLFLLMVISTVFSSVSVYADENYGNVEAKNTWGSQKGNYYGVGATSEGSISEMVSGQNRVNASGSISGGHGMYIKLVKYNSNTKSEVIVGIPILLYTTGFLDDIRNVDAGAGGATLSGGTAVMSSNFCAGNCSSSSIHLGRGPNGEAVNSEEPFSTELMNFFKGAKVENGGVYYQFNTDVAFLNGQYVPAPSSCTGSTHSVYGPEETSHYKRKDIKYQFTEGSSGVSESGVTLIHTNVSLGTVNLYDYIRKYLVGAVSGYRDENFSILRNLAGIVTIDTLQKAFKANINMTELDTYYLSFVPAIREITGNVVNSWASTQTSSGVYGESKWNWTCSVNSDLNTCAASVSASCERQVEKSTWECRRGGCRKYGCGPSGTSCCSYAEDCWEKKWTETETGTWSVGGCCGYRNSYSNTLISLFYEKESIIKPARISIRNDVIQTVTTSASQPESKHEVLVDDGNGGNRGTGTYEYFIGPNLNTAITGTSSNNKYYLYNGSQAFNSNVAKNNAVGVSYWWISDLTSCRHECPNSNDLSCIENYCDNVVGYDERANTQKIKAGCMLNFCGYKYTRTNCDSANPYRGMQSSDLDTLETSTCGMLDSGKGNTLDNAKTKVTCENDKVGAGGDPLREVFDQKTYINIACKETTGIGFKDISKDKVVPGGGIEYYVLQDGNKECTVFWDLESFKFAYASYHSEDVIRRNDGSEISTRQQLINMLNYFNSAQSRSINSSIGIDLGGGDYSYTWADLKYKKDLSDTSNVTEIVFNEKKNNNGYTLVKTYEEESSKLDIIANESVNAHRFLSTTALSVNRYLNNSNVENTYTFDKYCISSDGKAIVSKADDSGLCYVKKDGEEVYGRNVYYTNINATPNSKITDSSMNHSVTTTVSSYDGGRLVNMYTDYCPYYIGEELKCYIDVYSTDQTKEMHGNSIYVGGVDAELIVIDKQGIEDSVTQTSISALGKSDSRVISVNISDQRNGNEKIRITGTLQTENGRVVTCEKDIHLIDPSSYCGVSCKIYKIDALSDIYNLISTGVQTPRKYMSATSNNFTFVKVVPDVRDGKYYVRNPKTNPSRYVYGKVEGTMLNDGTVCNNLCWSGNTIEYNCPLLYKPADITGIKEYCINNWDKDINDYDSVEECQVRCKKGACPVNVRDRAVVSNFCSNYKDLGYSNESDCVNYCFYCPECTDEYVYRPVNNTNPFPESTRSTTGTVSGYLIGSNWIDKEHYITDDNNDLTSVTGVYANQTPEYVIDLDGEAIKSIKNYVEKYNDSHEGANAFLDYVYQKNTDENGKYYSAFINDNEINRYFVVQDGK